MLELLLIIMRQFHQVLISENIFTGTLSSPLIAGQCYRVSFKYSLAGESSKYTTSDLGVLFTDSIPVFPNTTSWTLPHTPQIVVNQFLIEDSAWVQIDRYFLASGGEQYITMGTYGSFDSLQILDRGTNGMINSSGFGCYVYFDDVSVEPTSLMNLPQLNLGNDTILCCGRFA